ncbi:MULTISPECIES: SPFH domain-containing protein [unclassified Flavobacterium]|uniref:SPFH domain-containing protein n=1 Tax=unclassified Flavobacterium TaxID=196869 RepID=UPI00086882BA|nr:MULTISPECIES: SPFH domain-containing protein [unclassified Flavobacterium]ODS79461.1 MAG: virion core protein (lumpy skin disease virus) [Chryseobacterium sp. SCN 40-13]OJV72828.1 MAG: virion core protein (lumpy skin disease virus) [Flavobacterium sp. 40-81]
MITSQFIDIIEAATPDPNLLMWKFEDTDKEIKNGAKLTVRESQIAVFLNEGQLADVFQPGLHTLSTENIPVLSRLKGWKYGFQSPFKADIYFVNTRQFVNNKWGTPAPIMMRDPEFGQVRVRAFGTFDIQIKDFETFFRQYAGSYRTFTIFELQYELRDFIAPKFGEVLAQENIAVKDIAGNVTELGGKITPFLKPYFAQFGIDLITFTITSVTLPDEVSAHYDKITNMNMVTDMDKFTRFSTAQAIGQQGTIANEGTTSGMIAGMMMNQMQQQMNPPAAQEDITVKLQKLKTLFESGLIDETEYKAKKTELIDKL